MPPKGQPGKPENEDPKVEILPSERPQQQEPAEVEVDATTGQPVTQAPAAAPSISADEFRKLQARLEYQARQNERQSRDFQEAMQLLRQQQPAQVPAEKTQQVDEVDAIAQQDWKKGVSILAEREAEKKFKALMETERQRQQAEYAKQYSTNQLEREKSWVLERTPSLNDETSDEYRSFAQVRNEMFSEDPTLSSNPRAPKLVWYEWRDRMKQAETPDQRETERLKRVTGGQSPQSRNISGPKTIKLTEDELDLCKRKGISPASYAQMKEANYKEGVTA